MGADLTEKSLPILSAQGEIEAALADGGAVVICAPTGSGKSTRVPQMALRAPWLQGEVVVLQPRRLAARVLAARVAQELDSPLGELVGFQTRHESRVSPRTRIRFVTCGLFLRQLLSGGTSGVGCVLLDEFHERSLEADAVLALLLSARARGAGPALVVMSATIDGERVAGHIGCPLISVAARSYPVTIIHEPPPVGSSLPEHAARLCRRLLHQEERGDVLIFMPGRAEIGQTLRALEGLLPASGRPALLPLHGGLPGERQVQAVQPSEERKVVVATNVAETSLTIPGVTLVIDSGLARIAGYDARRQLNVLARRTISRAAADQRAGRAGRTEPGSCWRLWAEREERTMRATEEPEILRLDLSELLLQLLAAEVPAGNPWLDPPPAPALARARELLELLGATAGGGLNAVGRAMAQLPMHPRLARMVVAAAGSEELEEVAAWAAILSERSIFLKEGEARFEAACPGFYRGDLDRAAAALGRLREDGPEERQERSPGVNLEAARAVAATARLYQRAARKVCGGGGGRSPAVRGESGSGAASSLELANVGGEAADKALLAAFPDRVARRRQSNSTLYQLSHGGGGELVAGSAAAGAELVVAAEASELVEPDGVVLRLGLAQPIREEWLAELHPGLVTTRQELAWDELRLAVVELTERRYRALTLASARAVAPPSGAATALLVARVRSSGLPLEGWTAACDNWIERVRFVAGCFPERRLVSYDEEEVTLLLEEAFAGAVRYREIRQRPCLDHLRMALSSADRHLVEEAAPERLTLPGGATMTVSYCRGRPPVGQATIQQLYGLKTSPRLARGRVALTIEILAPSRRPVQVTDDLASFWQRTYPQLRNQYARRYPRHEWKEPERVGELPRNRMSRPR